MGDDGSIETLWFSLWTLWDLEKKEDENRGSEGESRNTGSHVGGCIERERVSQGLGEDDGGPYEVGDGGGWG